MKNFTHLYEALKKVYTQPKTDNIYDFFRLQEISSTMNINPSRLSPAECVKKLLIWVDTDQGVKFWQEVHKDLERLEENEKNNKIR